MRVLNTLTACMLTAALAGCSLDSLGQSAPMSPAAEPDRAIHFSVNGSGKEEDTCKIPIEDKDITSSFNSDPYGCRNDDMRYFRLTDVRSATYITLRSKDCNEEEGWLFTMKTYIDPVTTDWIAIDDLKGYGDNGIIVAGLIMVTKEHEDENTTGKLFCVLINVSD